MLRYAAQRAFTFQDVFFFFFFFSIFENSFFYFILLFFNNNLKAVKLLQGRERKGKKVKRNSCGIFCREAKPRGKKKKKRNNFQTATAVVN